MPLIVGIIEIIGSVVLGCLVSVSIYAFADLIDLLLATEENTQATALILRGISKQSQSSSAADRAHRP